MKNRNIQARGAICVPLEVRNIDAEGNIDGYGSVFGVTDSYGDIVAAGAFNASLASHRAAGTMPAMLWQHDASEPIGVWKSMTEDEKGLLVQGSLVLETEKGRAAQALIKAGAINGLSIGFMAKQWAYDRATDIRTLTEIDLWEVSLVTFPANVAARVTGIKAALDDVESPKDAERVLREAGFSRAEATAFVSHTMRLRAEQRDAAPDAHRAIVAAQLAMLSLKL